MSLFPRMRTACSTPPSFTHRRDETLPFSETFAAATPRERRNASATAASEDQDANLEAMHLPFVVCTSEDYPSKIALMVVTLFECAPLSQRNLLL